MRIPLFLALLLPLAALEPAAAQTFFFHHSATPMPVPGGSTNFLLDETAPGALTPTVEDRSVATNATATWPAFTAMAFGSDTTLKPVASVLLFLSVNEHGPCLDIGADVTRVDDGVSIGSGTLTQLSLPKSKQGGTVGALPFQLEFSISDTMVPTGKSIAVTPSSMPLRPMPRRS